MNVLELTLKNYPAPWTAVNGDCYLAVAARDSKSLIYIDSKPKGNCGAKLAMLTLVATAPQAVLALKAMLDAFAPPDGSDMDWETLELAAESAREALAFLMLPAEDTPSTHQDGQQPPQFGADGFQLKTLRKITPRADAPADIVTPGDRRT